VAFPSIGSARFQAIKLLISEGLIFITSKLFLSQLLDNQCSTYSQFRSNNSIKSEGRFRYHSGGIGIEFHKSGIPGSLLSST
jgi:hypothetical protein